MNPELAFEILRKNPTDVLAIEAAFGGIEGIIKLLPHIEAIYATMKDYQARQGQHQ